MLSDSTKPKKATKIWIFVLVKERFLISVSLQLWKSEIAFTTRQKLEFSVFLGSVASNNNEKQWKKNILLKMQVNLFEFSANELVSNGWDLLEYRSRLIRSLVSAGLYLEFHGDILRINWFDVN